jgi:hypothetical protein
LLVSAGSSCWITMVSDPSLARRRPGVRSPMEYRPIGLAPGHPRSSPLPSAASRRQRPPPAVRPGRAIGLGRGRVEQAERGELLLVVLILARGREGLHPGPQLVEKGQLGETAAGAGTPWVCTGAPNGSRASLLCNARTASRSAGPSQAHRPTIAATLVGNSMTLAPAGAIPPAPRGRARRSVDTLSAAVWNPTAG